MSSKERTGRRDLLMSRWHRTENVRQWLGFVDAEKLERIDIDYAAGCPFCHHTVALIEEKNSAKPPNAFSTRNTQLLAVDAGIPAYCVTYTCVCGVTGDRHETGDSCDVAGVQVQQVAPVVSEVKPMLPKVYAFWLLSLRHAHICASEPESEAG